MDSLHAYSSGQSELGRQFARQMQMHTTDSAAVVEILRAEEREHPLTPARLAERVGLTRGATSILLNRLEAAGHVTRVRGHADRRLVTLHSAQAMNRAAADFFAPLRDHLGAVMSRYSSEELALVEAFVSELRDTVDNYTHPDGELSNGNDVLPEVTSASAHSTVPPPRPSDGSPLTSTPRSTPWLTAGTGPRSTSIPS